MLSNKVYTILKWITMVVLPGIGTLYFALASIWGFPYAEQVVGTIAALTTFLGFLLGISTKSYQDHGADGALLIDTSNPEKDVYRIELGNNFDVWGDQKTVTLKVDTDADLTPSP